MKKYIYGCILIVGLSAGLLMVYYALEIYIPKHPKQPKAYGSFPANPLWVLMAPDEITSTPVVDNGRMFIRTMSSILSVDPVDGKVIWKIKSPSPEDLSIAPLINDLGVYVAEANTTIAHYSTQTGEFVWKSRPTDFRYIDPATAFIEDMVLVNHLVIVARSSWELTAYDSHDGMVIWKKSVPNRANLYLTTSGNIVYLCADNEIRAFDVNNGDLAWEKSIEGYISDCIADEQTIFVLTDFSKTALTAFDLTTRNVNWRIESNILHEDLTRSIHLINHSLYISSARLTKVFPLSGTIEWQSKYTGPLETPVYIRDKVFIRNNETDLFMIDDLTGIITGSLYIQANTPMNVSPDRSPAVLSGKLYVPFGDKRLFVYQP